MASALSPMLVVVLGLLVVLELWRRRLRHRAPRWVHLAAIALFAATAGGLAYTASALDALFGSLDRVETAEKATYLARKIATALRGEALSIAALLVAVVVLAIGTWLARRLPEGGPIAELRRDR